MNCMIIVDWLYSPSTLVHPLSMGAENELCHEVLETNHPL